MSWIESYKLIMEINYSDWIESNKLIIYNEKTIVN